ncbi:trypsin-like peptidase domain-containing protein [Micromonospora sp. NPDC051141]|uniref:trypsin-like peptidase domain-containing protein n=1 Tax=Micromonospora sp. NPDC051141 TaxID=3364284 RepID=UPI0037AB12F4
MAGGYETGDGVPGQGGDGTAGRPGPLPPRIDPPGRAAPFPGTPTDPDFSRGVAAPEPARGTAAPGAAWGAAASGSTWDAAAPDPGRGVATPGAAWGSGAGHAGHPPFGGAPAASPVPTQPNAGSAWSGQPSAGSAYPSRPAPAAPSTGQPPSGPGQPLSGPAYPGRPASSPGQSPSGPGYPGQPTSGPAFPGQSPSGPAWPGQSGSGSAWPGQPTPGSAYPAGVSGQTGFGGSPLAGGPDPSRRRGRLPVVALVLAGVLAVVTGVQAYQIHRLDDRLAAADRRTAEAQGADARRLDGLEQRAGSLEKQAGAAFNPEAVASAVLPSVFRVRAGQFTGTAFAVGKAPAGGGTTLLTNFHVVESVFAAGERKVFLERTDQRFEATIIDTDKEKDLARLRTTATFGGLVAARTPVKSGQQIVVVGAPLGLQDSVTTGVVSAFRKDEGGSGPVIQFDAPINPGNSGGPVINGSKEVVGIATAKARDAEGIGLAVPIKTACDRFKLC